MPPPPEPPRTTAEQEEQQDGETRPAGTTEISDPETGRIRAGSSKYITLMRR
jgi:hypothetical protein